jgi:hypothetical protein
MRLDLPHRVSTALSNTQKLQRHLFCAERQLGVGDFLRVGNDPIQPLEKSASNLLICNERNFGPCGLQDFDARRDERRRGRRELNRALNGRPCHVLKSAGSRRNPHKYAGPVNEKGQARTVGLSELVEAARIEHASAARPPHSPLHAYPGLCI